MGTEMEVATPMENAYITRREFEEYQRRLDDKKAAWDKDLVEVKADVKEIRSLTTSVAELAQSMKAMTEEQKRQGQRLDKIESRDGESWRKFIGYILAALASAAFTFIFTRLGR